MAAQQGGVMRNLNTSLRRRGTVDPMARFDRLPGDLRHWLAGAALPWSAASALRLWRRALRETGCPHRARQSLTATEARLLSRDAARIWGRDYPT